MIDEYPKEVTYGIASVEEKQLAEQRRIRIWTIANSVATLLTAITGVASLVIAVMELRK